MSSKFRVFKFAIQSYISIINIIGILKFYIFLTIIFLYHKKITERLIEELKKKNEISRATSYKENKSYV